MAQYIEMECANEKCENREVWEAYVKFADYGDGSYDLIVCSDGPGLMSSIHCPECAEIGDEI